MSQWPLPSVSTTAHSARRRQGPGCGFEKKYTAKFRKHPPPRSPARGTSASTTMTACRSSGARGLTASPSSGLRSESRGTSWSRSSAVRLSSLCSTPLSRRWWTPWWKCGRSSTTCCLTSSRPSKCPRFFRTRSRSAPLSRSRRWPNNWWQCPYGASLQVIDRAVDIAGMLQRQGTHSVKLCIFGLSIDMPVVVHVKVVDIIVVVQRPFPLVQFSRPLRFLSRSPLTRCSTSWCAGPAVSSGALVVFVPGQGRSRARCVQRQMPGWFRVLKTAKVPQLQYSDKVVDVLAVQVVVLPQVQVCGYGRRCDHSGSASDSVHCRSRWTFSFATETGSDEEFLLAVFPHFSRSSGLSWI